ncbi:MAG: hypothetical protein ACRDKJ_12365 [Actinomycetota bacterium]
MRRSLAFLLAVVAVGGILPAHTSAQVVASATPAATPCRPLPIPELEEVDADDLDLAELLVGRVLCAGQRLRVESDERRLRIDTPDLSVRERESEVDVSLPRTPLTAAAPEAEPEEKDPVDLALETGAEIKQEHNSFVHETPTSRHETNEDETKIDGRDFDYESKETEEKVEEPDFESEEKETEEEFRSR